MSEQERAALSELIQKFDAFRTYSQRSADLAKKVKDRRLHAERTAEVGVLNVVLHELRKAASILKGDQS